MADEPIEVAVAYPFEAATVERFRAVSPRLELRLEADWAQAAIDRVATPETQVLVATGLPSRFEPGWRLRWLQIPSAGVDHVVGAGAWPDHVSLTNARGVYAGTIGQFVISAILRSLEPHEARARAQRDVDWRDPGREDVLDQRRARGLTLVLVGYGGIGREIGRLADALGMRVIAVKADPERREDDVFRLPGTGDPSGSIPERIVGVDGLGEAAREADYLVSTLPMTSASRGLISAAVIDALPASAWVVSVGRGSVIDEVELVAALEAERIGGAILDVFEQEPLPAESPLWRLPNVVITPHIAGAGAGPELGELVLQNLRRYVAGERLLNPIDTTRGY